MHSALRFAMLGAGLLAGATLSAAEPPTLAVKMEKESFVPAKVSTTAGTQVTWTNTDSVPHSVTANDKRFDSGPILPGKSFQWTATDAGTVAYHCIFHPSMTAQLTVSATSGANAK
jgi:plastocyanin